MAEQGAGGLRVVGRLRVRYGETDQMRFAYHAHAAVWFDQARTELLRASGHCYRALEEGGLWLPVLALHVDYHRAAHYDDELELLAGFRGEEVAGRPSPIQFAIDYEVRRGGELCYSGWTRHCFMAAGAGGGRRAVRIPPELRPLLQVGVANG
ncbi:MAG: thioesterase family protein [bacterium]|nr:thioesterase family protein [bacterium]